MSYEWAKAIHVMAWASWMAGLFYLPRLFVYHAERAPPGTDASEMLKVMERKLLGFIMWPAMLVTWATGLWLAFGVGVIDWTRDFWMHAKMLLVVAMTGAHYLMRAWMETFAADANRRSGRYYRVANEIPTLFFALIVILVIVRPF